MAMLESDTNNNNTSQCFQQTNTSLLRILFGFVILRTCFFIILQKHHLNYWIQIGDAGICVLLPYNYRHASSR